MKTFLKAVAKAFAKFFKSILKIVACIVLAVVVLTWLTAEDYPEATTDAQRAAVEQCIQTRNETNSVIAEFTLNGAKSADVLYAKDLMNAEYDKCRNNI